MAWTWTWKAKGKILCLSLFCVEVLMIHLGMARFVATFFSSFALDFGFFGRKMMILMAMHRSAARKGRPLKIAFGKFRV